MACAPEEKPLWVVSVIHGRRSPRVIAAILFTTIMFVMALHADQVFPSGVHSG
jgi:hypothetical protein